MNTSHVQTKALLVGAFVFVIVADQAIKNYASQSDTITLIPGLLTFVHVLNTGFLWFHSGPALWVNVLLLLLIAVMVFVRRNIMTFRESLAFAFLMGGGISNVFDRFRFGGVYDVFQFHSLGIANLADGVIILGILLFLTEAFRTSGKEVETKEIS